MHHIMEYSALAGAGWLSSNILFVITWCWLHSRKRRGMPDDSRTPSIFKLRTDSAYQPQ
jgi:hypothetical protein